MPELFNVSVQGVPSRAHFHEQIKAQLPHASFVLDTEQEGRYFAQWKRALLQADRAKPYHLVIQDDVKPCVDFDATVDKICANAVRHFRGRELPIVGLYCPRSVIRSLKGTGVNFVRMLGGSWGQSHLFPTSRIEEFLEYEGATFVPEYDSDDGRITFWSCDIGEQHYLTVPSLLEHLAPTASTLGFNNKTKVAAWFAGDESPLGYDWDFAYTAQAPCTSLTQELKIRYQSNTLTQAARMRFGIGIFGDGKIRRK